MRVAYADIDLAALRHNYRLAQSLAPNSNTMAVIKTDAYGHGLTQIGKGLQDIAQAFAVCTLGEAVRLREHGIQQPILVLHGFYREQDIGEFLALNLSCVVHHRWQLEALKCYQASDYQEKPLSIWLKIDSGMGRLGFKVEQFAQVLQQVLEIKSCALECVMSHMSSADDLKDGYTDQQLNGLSEVCKDLHTPLSFANSASLMGWPNTHASWNRPGIMLYGVSPFADIREQSATALGLQAVMTLRSKLFAINTYSGGDYIGYGHHWRCPEDMLVGFAAIGYGDGYPRNVPSGTSVLVNGQVAPIIGRVSMDSIAIDLRDLKNPQRDDDIVLWGQGLPVEEIASAAGTIAYELLCSMAHANHRYE